MPNLQPISVSVIILNYNGKDLTVECIDSVLKSNYSNFDIVLIDNGSTDDSLEYLQRRYRRNKKIKVIGSAKNRQFTGGFNFGAKHARGDKIALLSNDMTVDPNWILEMIKLAKKNSKYIIQPKILSYYNKKVIDHIGGKYNYFGYTKPIGKGETDQGQYNSNFELDHISATMFMIDRKFFLKVGGYDEWFVSHYEDIDLYLRAKKLGGKSLYAWRSKIYHKGSVTYKRFIIPESTLFHIRKNRIRVVLKNFSGIEKYIRLFLLALTYIPLIIADSIHLNKQRSFISLKSIKAALQPQTYYSLEEM